MGNIAVQVVRIQLSMFPSVYFEHSIDRQGLQSVGRGPIIGTRMTSCSAQSSSAPLLGTRLYRVELVEPSGSGAIPGTWNDQMFDPLRHE
jgi:hypothetical protein